VRLKIFAHAEQAVKREQTVSEDPHSRERKYNKVLLNSLIDTDSLMIGDQFENCK
jgi:hypothetical protein